MPKPQWIYPELRFIKANQDRYPTHELKDIINKQFHGGVEIRSEQDIEKIKRGRTILGK